MRLNLVCAAVLSVFFAAPISALIINTPSFVTPGPLRLNFTTEPSDPIGAFFNIAVAANATRLVDNVDLSVGFADVKIEMLPGTYFIFAIGNDTDGGSYLGTSPDFLVIEPSSITTSSASSFSATSSSSSPSSSSATSSSSSSTSSSAKSSTITGTAVTEKTGSPSNNAVVTSKKSPSTAVIVGIVIGAVFLLAILILLLFLRRRKQQRTRRRDSLEAPGPMMQSSGALASETYPSSRVDPFITPPSSTTSLSIPQQRQQYITNEMRLLRKQMEELRRSGNSTSVSTSVPDSSIISSPTATSRTDASADLERSRRQNDELQSRIAQLEAQLQSAWALGLSNDPPPGYVA